MGFLHQVLPASLLFLSLGLYLKKTLYYLQFSFVFFFLCFLFCYSLLFLCSGFSYGFFFLFFSRSPFACNGVWIWSWRSCGLLSFFGWAKNYLQTIFFCNKKINSDEKHILPNINGSPLHRAKRYLHHDARLCLFQGAVSRLLILA